MLSDPPSTNLTLVPHSPNQLIHYWARRAKCTRSSYTFTDSYKMASKDHIYTFRIGTASGWKLFQWPSSRVSEAHSVTRDTSHYWVSTTLPTNRAAGIRSLESIQMDSRFLDQRMENKICFIPTLSNVFPLTNSFCWNKVVDTLQFA